MVGVAVPILLPPPVTFIILSKNWVDAMEACFNIL